MPRNKLGDLNNLLFEELERLNDDELKGDDLHEEMDRAKAMGCVAEQIIANCTLMLKVRVAQQEFSGNKLALPETLED